MSAAVVDASRVERAAVEGDIEIFSEAEAGLVVDGDRRPTRVGNS